MVPGNFGVRSELRLVTLPWNMIRFWRCSKKKTKNLNAFLKSISVWGFVLVFFFLISLADENFEAERATGLLK